VGSYFADWVLPEARLAFDRGFGEVEVITTLDSQLQRRAQQAMARALAGAAAAGATQGALVAMRTDGRVVALVGGKSYRESKFNRAVQAERQPGSAFKTVTYLAALRSGMTPQSLVVDQPVTIGDWTPENHEGRYAGGPVTLADAFARSSNVAAARLAQQLGPRAIIAAARDLGIAAELPDDATVALGTGSMSLLELTSAYAAVAAGSAPVTPRGLANQTAAPKTTSLSRREREGLLTLLRAAVANGTGKAANLGEGVYGKTGTSQDYRDAWFVGFAGELVVGVWMGNDDNTPMRRVTGGSWPAQAWRDFMSYALTRKDFATPVARAESEELVDLEAPFAPEDLDAPLEGLSPEGLTTPDAPFGVQQPPSGPLRPPLREAPAPRGLDVRPEELDLPPPADDEPLEPELEFGPPG